MPEAGHATAFSCRRPSARPLPPPEAAAGRGRGDASSGHGGDFAGISSMLDMHIDTGFTFIAMSNYDDGANIAARKCRELLPRVK